MFGRGGKRRGSRSKRNVSSKRKHTDAATGATALLVSPSNPRPGFTPYTTPNKRKTKKASRRGRGKRKGKSRAARPTTSMSVGSGDVLSMSERDRRIGIAHFLPGDELSYYDRWVTPLLGLNDGTRYAGRPTGNRPELMPLDTSLFKDVDDAFNRHKVATRHLAKADPKRFSL